MSYPMLGDMIIEMLYLLKRNGYYESFTGVCKTRGAEPEGNAFGLDYTCASCRNGRKEVSEILEGRCPLCNLTFPTLPLPLRKVMWIDWSSRFRIIPNAFPYFENHVNFITSTHESQDIIREPSVISNLFSFYRGIGKNEWMLVFNHLIGNSLNHFHVHATTQINMPLVQIIKRKKFSQSKRVRVFKFTNCFRGILVTKPTIDIINKIIRRVRPSPIEFINFGWFGDHFIIFVRRLVEDPLGNTLGSSELMGYILSCDMEKLSKISEACRYTVVSYARMREIIDGIV